MKNSSSIKIYSLRILPPSPIFEEILEFKKQFVTIFGKQPLADSKPHITIAEFVNYIEFQEILIKYFNQLSNIEKFELEIKGFEVFENNANVLMLQILKTEKIEEIQKHLKILWIRDLHRKLATLRISSTPHITISKTDGIEMLHKAFEHFRRANYTKQFDVNQLMLVSRYEYGTWDWEHYIKLR